MACMNIEKNLVAVVIPVYRPQFTIPERISLLQARKVFSSYPVYFLCPEGLRMDEEYSSVPRICFAPCWFSGIRSYSAMMLMPFLYEKFCEYTYVLICQTDAFVFRDELEAFCHMGYDYIGAPWIHGITHYVDAAHILHYVGNGGFSLRRTSAFLSWLDKVDLSEKRGAVNEDVLIAAYGLGCLDIAPEETALRFAFDMDPGECFRRNSLRLPMGCHAWARIDMEFWRPYIEAEGYDTSLIPGSIRLGHYERRYKAEEKQKRLLEILGDRDRISGFIMKLTDKGRRKLYVWGTGVWGDFVGRIFLEYGIKIEAFFDGRKNMDEFLGIQVLGCMENRMAGSCFFIAVEQHTEISCRLEGQGLKHGMDYLLLEDIENEWI